jgi:hypothetical protein
LFQAPNFIIAKLRVGYCVFDGKKKLEEKREDYDLFCYDKKGWKAKLNEEVFEITRSSISENGRENAEKIPQLIRRLLEIRKAKELESDYVVLDGTLDGTFEKEELETLPENVLGLCKTNSVRTTKGNSYTNLLNKLNKGTFIAKNIVPKVSFVRLHRGPYIFRIDGVITNDLLYWLSVHAKDPQLRGYPYGLIVADRIARIPDYETKAMKLRLFSSLSKEEAKEFRELLSGKDIHEFLDGNNIY